MVLQLEHKINMSLHFTLGLKILCSKILPMKYVVGGGPKNGGKNLIFNSQLLMVVFSTLFSCCYGQMFDQLKLQYFPPYKFTKKIY